MKKNRLARRDFANRGVRGTASNRPPHPKMRHMRLKILFVCVGCWLAVVCWRLTSLQITDVDTWKDWSAKQHSQSVTLASQRGPVLDREGKALAVSIPASSIYARPRQLRDKEKAAKTLSAALKLPYNQVAAKLNSSEPFVWIKRQVPRAVGDLIEREAIKGVGYLIEAKRVYPYGQAASTLIGRVGIDGNGLSGLESVYEERLKSDPIKSRVGRDALGQAIETGTDTGEALELPKGEELHLTLDAELQLILNEELDAAKATTNAKATLGVMVDATTGEILAMGQAPEANFNSDVVNSKDSLKNLIIESVFEPGSVMKPVVAAVAIDAGLMRSQELVNCEHGHFRFAGHNIKDVHPSDVISLKDVVIRSSNIGMTKVGMRLGKDRLYAALRRFGFGQSSELGLPGETGGLFRPLDRWAQVDVATHSFGQGIAVTPLQMVRAISAIANGGTLPKFRVVDDGSDYVARRVLSEKTAAEVREMLYGVVEDEHGTGKLAAIPGVRIGGKTGTAQKARSGGRGYESGAYVASFVGFADASQIGISKKIALMIAVDEAKTTSIYGGTLAGPVFQRVMSRSLKLLATRNELSGSIPEREVPATSKKNGMFTEIAYHP